jgi:hypothetical protein
MKRLAASLALLSTAVAGAAPAAAPHCAFARDPVITCNGPDQAAAAWHLYGFNMRAAKDSNNRALLARAGCSVTDHDAPRHPVLEARRGRLATKWGWTDVVLVDVDGYIDVWVAGGYLAGRCEKWSTEAGDRNKALAGVPVEPHPTYAMPTGEMPGADPAASTDRQTLPGGNVP